MGELSLSACGAAPMWRTTLAVQRGLSLSSILSFARDLSLNVIVTAVTTEAELGELHAMGFPMAQGTAVGEPASAQAMPAIIDAPLPASFALR